MNMRGGGPSVVATVGSESVSLQELETAVDRDLEAYGATGAMAENLRKTLRGQTLNSLIQSKLFVLEAERMGIAVTDAEAMEEIQAMPYFQDKDKKTFSVELYRNVLAANKLSPAQFEKNVRTHLIQRKMASFLENRIRVTDEEVKREYSVSNDKRNLQFVRITKDNAFKQMKVEPADVQKFLADPAKANMIQANYTSNKQKYDRDEEICARHILKRTPPAAAADKADEKAPKEFAALKPTPGNFAELAKKNSEDPGSKESGGDLGCFSKGMMDKAFEAVAYKTNVGQVSAPVKSSFGWHYIYVYKKNPAIKIPLENVKTEIAEELLKRERLDEIRKINREQAENVAKNWGKKLPGFDSAETGFFNAVDGFVPKIGRADEVLKAAFDDKAAIQKGPQVFEAQGTFIVAAVKARKSADPAKFAEQKDVQERTIRSRKQQAFLPAWMQHVQKNHKVVINESLLQQL